MDFKKYLKDKYFILFLLVLVFGIALRIYYFNINTGVWWDEAEYLTRAKEIAGITNIGQDIWSARRPFFLVLIWAGLYKLGATEIYIKLTELLFSIGALVAAYYLAKEMYNEKVALITTLALSTLGLHLFLTARLMTEIPSATMALIAYYFFFKYYVNEKDKSKLWISFLFIGLALFIRSSIFLGIIPMLLIILLKEGKGLFKNKLIIKSLLAGAAIISPYIIYLMIRYKTINLFYVFKRLTGIGEGRFQFSLDPWLFIDYLKSIPGELKIVYFVLMIIGLYIFVDFFLGFDILFKNKDKKVYRELFTLIWIILPPVFLGFFTSYSPSSYAEPRYLIPVFPGMLMLSANGLLYVEKLIKKIDKRIAILAVIVILAFATYNQLTYADQIIDSKKDSFSQIKPIGEFLKGKTSHMILSNSNQMELMYYVETYVEGFSDEEKDLLTKIKNNGADYVIISTMYQNNPQWHYEVPQKYSKYLKPVYGTFFDKEQKYPAMIVFEVNKQEIAKI